MRRKRLFQAKLTSLAKTMKADEWPVFEEKEAGDLERAGTKVDSEASGSTTEPPEGE